jgi:hypothetical protein
VADKKSDQDLIRRLVHPHCHCNHDDDEVLDNTRIMLVMTEDLKNLLNYNGISYGLCRRQMALVMVMAATSLLADAETQTETDRDIDAAVQTVRDHRDAFYRTEGTKPN